MNTTSTKERTITVSKKDVFFDIDALSLYYAEASGGENPVRDNRVAVETAAAGQGRVMKRLCDHRASDIREVMKKFIKSTTGTGGNDTLDTGNWTYTIVISTEAEDNALATIADFCHEYIVTGALNDYYAELGVNGNRESLQNRADKALARIRELIYFRPMP